MKNNKTFDIEYANLQSLFQQRQFDTADQLATRMLHDYNTFDYELLLKRARIRQCLMRYDDALADASLALNGCPQRADAYSIVSDCLIASQKLTEAVKLVEIMHRREPENQVIR